MKLKTLPEDFRVEELLRLKFTRHGSYSIYRLEKRGWNTIELLEHLARRYHLGRLSRAGLKDRHSCSVQYVSSEGRGPGRIAEEGFTLKHIGYSTLPVSRKLLLGNRFTLVIRDLSPTEAETARGNLPGLRTEGFANYHDEQRFGSSRPGEGFIARKLIQGDLAGALRMYLDAPGGPEPAPVATQPAQSPDDPVRALRRIPHDLLELYITGYQSWLWNETLVALIRDFKLPSRAVAYAQGEMLFFTGLTPDARRFFLRHEIPVAAPGTPLKPEPVAKALNSVLTREGLHLNDFKFPLQIVGLRFKPWTRPGIVIARNLALTRPAPDDLHAGKQKLELTFELPPGSFATVLVKRLLLA